MVAGYGNALSAYKNNSVNYASKEQLLLMLVDGAVKFSKIARQAIFEEDVKLAHVNILKTQDIFYELMETLDVNKAGNWGNQMMGIYKFIVDRLVSANFKKSVEVMDEIIPLIEEIRDTWHEAYKQSKLSK